MDFKLSYRKQDAPSIRSRPANMDGLVEQKLMWLLQTAVVCHENNAPCLKLSTTVL
jgi:hypothetical protein